MDQGKPVIDIIVGLFVLVGLAALAFLALRVSNLADVGTGGESYTVVALFDNVGGLKARAPVRMAGVRVGRVASIGYDEEAFAARVTMEISADYSRIPEDSAASILTAGLLGEQYIGIAPGGEELFLEDGGELSLTQPALILENVIGQVLFDRAQSGGSGDGS